MTNPNKPRVTITAAMLKELDEMYDARTEDRRATRWNELVYALRAIRRQVEAGTVVEIEDGPTLRSWNGFYTWAHGRYHMLEDGADPWIGDDR